MERKSTIICLRVLERGIIVDNLKWLKVDLLPSLEKLYPELGQNISDASSVLESEFVIPYFQHQHSSHAISVRFSESRIGRIEFRHPCDIYCLPPSCESIVIDSAVYCIGGDEDFDGLNDLFLSPYRRSVNKLQNLPVCSSRKLNTNNLIYYCEFGNKSEPRWERGVPLCSPRYCPTLVVAAGRLFIFGGNRLARSSEEEKYVPFVEVFDPKTNTCSPLPNPPFKVIHDTFLFVTALHFKEGDKIYVASRRDSDDIQYLYDIKSASWMDLKSHDFLEAISDRGSRVAKGQEGRLYWLKNIGWGNICSYDFEKKVFVQGPIVGLHHELPFRGYAGRLLPLICLEEDLLCLIWDNRADGSHKTHFHFSILKVYESPSGSLTATLVACYSYVVDGDMFLEAAYLILSTSISTLEG